MTHTDRCPFVSFALPFWTEQHEKQQQQLPRCSTGLPTATGRARIRRDGFALGAEYVVRDLCQWLARRAGYRQILGHPRRHGKRECG